MSKIPNRELITIDGKNVVVQRDTSPMENGGILENAEALRLFNIFDDKFQPSNYGLADGKPLRMYDAKTVKIDLSKRSKEDMGFWHRNADAHEIIFCVKGALRWETEMGIRIVRPGDMLFIPRGIAHRSTLCEESEEENVLVELKISEELTYVAEDK
ncbi:MAG: homogentisate 1,2-dioxygenase [Rhodobiaceae bacterium]|nr:homogentisate 1,2-dioxygenase [Rhodobiaceae bacterium]MCC0014551.1 homogentisate 1,2-dioxygenase [Rhodobiaceae bacterium]MCC0052112.1 homogentisate 1,2-dioxygenase [Rhodobiaceae bacterium]MCC0061368.1 homogentisate 1,2-dioxygenase [Rhodobiaceae bacterium]